MLPVCSVGEDGSAVHGYGYNLWVCAPDAAYAPSEYANYMRVKGLSIATATVSGVATLVRGVNRDMTWRDVKLLLAQSARKNDGDDPEWEVGSPTYEDPSVSYSFNPQYGFGLVDAGAAVALAREWVNAPPMKTATVSGSAIEISDWNWNVGPVLRESTVIVEDDGETTPLFTEHVEVRMHLQHSAVRDLSIELVSPSGVESKLLWPDAGARRSGVNYYNFSLGSARHLGENPVGEWTLRVSDHIQGQSGTISSWSLVVRGHRPNNPATGLPTISGTAEAGETLTADTSGIDDQDGLTNPGYSYQWIHNDGGADMAGETASTYTVSDDDVGRTIKVRVSFTDDAGNAETLVSAATGEVVVEAGPLTGFTVVDASSQPQTVLGTLTDGGVLTLDYPANGSYGVQVDTGSGVEIGSVRLQLTGGKSVDQTEGIAPYSLYGDDGNGALHGQTLPVGDYTLKATAYSESSLGGEKLGTLEVSFAVAAANTAATGQPTIDGTTQVGETLTADTSAIDDADGLVNVSYSYQWLRNDGNDDAEIAGANGETYTLAPDDEGKTIKVRVSFTDNADNEESLTSAASDSVVARPNSPATRAADHHRHSPGGPDTDG